VARRRKIRPVAVDPATGNAVSPRPFVGLCLIAAAFFLYAASVVLAPWWVVAIGLLAWLALLAQSLRWWEPHPDRLPWLGVTALVLWAVLTVGGGIAFGWHGVWRLSR
jgi:hypothetical protein